jgi:hypothetical protein
LAPFRALIAGTLDERPLHQDTEARLASLSELVATAISNTESLAELTASRARVVTAADATLRRIERNLHDGAQQRLVSLGLTVHAARAAVPPQLGDLDGELAHVDDWFALAVGLLVIGHIFYAVKDSEARRGMRTGRVSASWAHAEHAAWADEVLGAQQDVKQEPMP